MADAPVHDPLPTTVLTGFLGSGKTTFLRRALRSPELSDTAVVVNEIGEIAIDHYLVDFVEGEVLELPGGCLCCAMREDLARTLRDLLDRRDAGTVRPFGRIVIETSGLADPAPILFTLGADPVLDARLSLARVVTLVDAVTGADTLRRFAEAARQVAVADAIVISKTDLAPFGAASTARLDALNANAERLLAADADPRAVLFGGAATRAAGGREGVDGRVDPGHDDRGNHAVHSHGIETFSIVLDKPMSRFDFAKALGGLSRERGNDLLRVKGLVAFADCPDRPAVVQAAQHTMFAPEWLDAWPDDDRRSRLVFVVQDIPRAEVLAHFALASPAVSGSRPSRPQADETSALH
jgi:G3E family GTPase